MTLLTLARARAHPAGLKALRHGISGRCVSYVGGRQESDGSRGHMAARSIMVLCRTWAVPAPNAQWISSTHLLSLIPLLPLAMPPMQRIHAQALMKYAHAHRASSLPGPTCQEWGKRGGPWGVGSAWLLQECADLMVLETGRGLRQVPRLQAD